MNNQPPNIDPTYSEAQGRAMGRWIAETVKGLEEGGLSHEEAVYMALEMFREIVKNRPTA